MKTTTPRPTHARQISPRAGAAAAATSFPAVGIGVSAGRLAEQLHVTEDGQHALDHLAGTGKYATVHTAPTRGHQAFEKAGA